MNFRVTYDKEADAAYIYLKTIGPGEASYQLRPAVDIILDINRDGALIGIEVLRATTSLPREVLDGAELQAPVNLDGFSTAEPEYLSRQRREAAEKARRSNPHDTQPSDLVAGDFSKYAMTCPACHNSKDVVVSSRREVLTKYPDFGAPPLHVLGFTTYVVTCKSCEAVGVGSTPLLALQNMSKE